jgi:class 3 adenylate cyclase/tetratricopeptide (TPR) repeat protein
LRSAAHLDDHSRPGSDDGLGALAPYQSRLALQWLAESPGAAHQCLAGTVLYVDVSGFTALTERLAARGKVGAEEITEVIGTVFSELLGIAACYGADLLKWGGDAVLLFFAEPGSAARATRAAVLMTRSMKRIGRMKTSAGRVTLGVSIGAHSGDFDFYLVGDHHRELIITGPAATETARMEGIAEAGEVVVSAATAARLEPGVLGGPKAEGLVVTEAPEADTAQPTLAPAISDTDLASLVPADRRARLTGGGEQSEHRQATVAFLEFSGIDALTAEGGGGAVAAALGPIISATQEAAERRGVYFHETDIGGDGGKIVLIGGVPVVRGNDAERVLRAAHDVVSGHPTSSPVRLRAGVNAGRVFVFSHDFDVVGRRIFAVTGDAVNLAARVMGKSVAGQVVATEGVLVRARNPFEIEPLPPFNVKGKSQPVIAAALGRPRQGAGHDTVRDLPFAGREAEMAEVLAAAAAAAEGAGSVIEVTGAPGIGKSRLITEAMDHWSLGTLRVACEEYESATPYLPFRRVFRRLLGLVEDTPPQVAATVLREAVRDLAPDMEPFLPLLAGVVDVPVPVTREVDELEPRFRRQRLELFVVRLLRAYLVTPSALVFEDAHAMDEASASLVGRIAAGIGEWPLLMVLTCRRGSSPLGEGPGPALLLDLEPLGAEAAAQLAGSGGEDGEGAAKGLAPTQVAAIVARAAGNPLFLRELLRTAVEAGGVDALPDSLEPLLVAQIDLLAPADRQVLRAAAVLGAHFEPPVVQELLEGGVRADEAAWARLGAFVAPTATGWRFAHGLMRDAAYEGLSFKRRRELHARAAHAIEARAMKFDEAAGLLSLHWLHAENFDAAWLYSRLAGDRARALWANADAATLYARALEAAGRLALPASEVMAVAEALGDACELTAGYDRARHAYDRARRVGQGEVDRARLLRKLGVLHEREGRYRPALACYTRGRQLLNGTSAASATERCELDLASAGIRQRQGRYTDSIRFATEAAEVAEAAGHPSGLAHALYLRYAASVYLGTPEEPLGQRSLTIFEELGDLVGQANVLNNQGIGAYYLGRWVDSLDHYERSRATRLRAGDVVGAATQENNIAEILSDQGKFAEARALLESARATWTSAGYRVGAALASSNLGRLTARAGDAASGRHLLEAALEEFQNIQSPIFTSETELRLAECHLLSGGLAEAAHAAVELLEAVRGRRALEQTEVGGLRVLGTAGWLAQFAGLSVPSGSLGRPDQVLDEAERLALVLEAPYELALVLGTRSVLAQLTGAADRTDRRRAEQIFSDLGVRQAVITWSAAAGGPLFARDPEGGPQNPDGPA